MTDQELEDRRHRERMIPDGLMQLAVKDATVCAGLKVYTYGHTTYTEALEQIVKALVAEKAGIRKKYEDDMARDVRPFRFPDPRR